MSLQTDSSDRMIARRVLRTLAHDRHFSLLIAASRAKLVPWLAMQQTPTYINFLAIIRLDGLSVVWSCPQQANLFRFWAPYTAQFHIILALDRICVFTSRWSPVLTSMTCFLHSNLTDMDVYASYRQFFRVVIKREFFFCQNPNSVRNLPFSFSRSFLHFSPNTLSNKIMRFFFKSFIFLSVSIFRLKCSYIH